MRRNRRRGIALSAVLALGVLAAGCAAPSWHSELVSVASSGDGPGNGSSRYAAFSPDGTKVAFESSASDLVPGDANGTTDVFVRDLTTGATTLVSVDAGGAGSGNGRSNDAVFAGNDEVVFQSWANNLGAVDTNDALDLYVRDLTTGTAQLVSANAAGTAASNGTALRIASSPDGTKVAFASNASDLGPPDPFTTQFDVDLYVRDLTTGVTTLATANAEGTDGANGTTILMHAAFSGDGTKIVFDNSADNFGPTDLNNAMDVYERDLVTGAMTLVSVNAAGSGSANGGSGAPKANHDGSKVVFDSSATDLGPTHTNAGADVYVRDLTTGTTQLVSVNTSGSGGANASSDGVGFSPDGTAVAFRSGATDLPGGTGDAGFAYVRNLVAGTTTLVAPAEATSVQFSPDGSKVVFVTGVQGLGPNDDNYSSDVYVRVLATGTIELVSANAAGTNASNGSSAQPRFGPDSKRIVFDTTGSDLGSPDTNEHWDVYIATLR